MRSHLLVWLPFLAAISEISVTASQNPRPAEPGSAVAALTAEAKALRPLLKSDLARRFLDAASSLPPVAPRTLFRDETGAYLTQADADSLPEEKRKSLRSLAVDERLYYTTRYGSSLAYARPLELLAESGFRDVKATRILDYGYGAIGHLRLLASIGAEVTGVDVDPLLKALYASDSGQVKGLHGRDGSLRILHGRWPAESAVTAAVGEGYDLFISKNTLKNGYVHPAKPVAKGQTIDLGVPDEEFVRNLYRILKPGGSAMIYNLCPAQNPPDKPYLPMADGRSPFPRETWEAAGFRVLKFDEVDDAGARDMAKSLGWDQGPGAMDLQKNLFCWFTLVRKPH